MTYLTLSRSACSAFLASCSFSHFLFEKNNTIPMRNASITKPINKITRYFQITPVEKPSTTEIKIRGKIKDRYNTFYLT